MSRKRLVPNPQDLEKMPTGIEEFDEITNGGLPCNRTTLIIGGPGCGKTIFALQTLVNGVGLYGEPGIFVAFEEKSHQIISNAASFGWDLATLEQEEKLFFLDAHLSAESVQGGERNRALMIVKSRGTRHSNQVRELILSDQGVTLTDVYTTGGEVLMGSLRWEKMHMETLEKNRTRAADERKRSELALSEVETLARLEALKRQLESQRAELALHIAQQKVQEEEWRLKQKDMGEIRDADKEA